MHWLADWHWAVIVRRADNNGWGYGYLLPAPDSWARVEALNARITNPESSMVKVFQMCLVILFENRKDQGARPFYL